MSSRLVWSELTFHLRVVNLIQKQDITTTGATQSIWAGIWGNRNRLYRVFQIIYVCLRVRARECECVCRRTTEYCFIENSTQFSFELLQRVEAIYLKYVGQTLSVHCKSVLSLIHLSNAPLDAD